jgi:diguanylate cyclase (GGDEF)-like protein/PAS domain S-box-containing protein
MEKHKVEKTGDLICEKAFQMSPSPMAITDFWTGSFIRVNDAFCKVTGCRSDEIIGRTAADLDVFENTVSRETLIRRLLEEGPIGSCEVKVRRKDGSVHLGGISVSILEENGHRMLLVVINDISEKKSVDKQLYDSETRYMATFEQSAVGMCHLTLDGKFIRVNQKMCEMLGYSQDEFQRLSFISITLPDDTQSSIDAFKKLLTGEIPFCSLEKRYFRKDGKVLWADVTSSLIRDRKGDPQYMSTVIQDISGRKSMEWEIELSQAQFRSLYENIDEGVALHRLVYTDEQPADYVIVDVNPKYEKILNLKREDVVGKTASAVYNTETAPYLDEYSQVAQTGVPYRFETYFAPMNRHFRISAAPWGQNGFSTIFSDITEQVNGYKALELSRERLQTAQRIAHIGNWEYDMGMKRMWASEEVFSILGLECDSPCIDNKNYFPAIIHPQDRADTVEQIRRLIESKGEYAGEFRIVRANDSKIRWVRIAAKMDLGRVCSRCMMAGVLQDITGLRAAQEKLDDFSGLMRYIIEHSRSAVAVYDKGLRYMYVSQRYLECYNLDGADVIGRHHYDVFPNLPQRLKDVHQRALRGEVLSSEEDSILSENGRIDWVCWECRPWYESDGSIGGIIIYTEFINERRQMQQAILNEKERFRTTLLSVGDGVIATDNRGLVTVINPVAEKLTGWTFEDASGKPLEMVFRIVNEFTRETCENPVKRALESGSTVALTNHTVLISADGKEIPIEDSAAPIKDEAGNITGVVLVFRDFTEKREKQRQVEYLSMHDQLTGLYNRRFFEEELRRLDTADNLPFSIVMLDVNGLKLVNDAFGHKAGDALLKKVAHVMTNECRNGEAVSRIGGDEFIILLPKTDEEAAKKLMGSIKDSMAGESIQGLQVSVSIGVNTKCEPRRKIDEVLKVSEDLLYRDKIFDRNSQRYEAIQMIMRSLHEKIPRERQHSFRVGELCGRIGKAMGMHPNMLSALITAAELHDIGKIAISNDILDKPGKLNDAEWLEIKRHPEVGYNILSSANAYAPLADIVLAHHERWDGRGYPNGLRGSRIPLNARIIAVADSYDAMIEDRPYRKALTQEQAIDQLMQFSGIQFDADIVDCFINQVLCPK